MAKVSRADVVSMARISNIDLNHGEDELLAKQLEEVLTYALRVEEWRGLVQTVTTKNSNVFRKDIINPFDAEALRVKAPEREGDYFVVPIILEGADQSASVEY
jgi:aspartyl/glutamyl-tRNA(Asn/Gln) amidotransferase C subunit